MLNPQEVKSAALGLWLPEPQDSLSDTLCKVYGISKLSPVFDDLVALHLELNPDVFAANRTLEKKVIYLADLYLNQGIGLKADTKDGTHWHGYRHWCEHNWHLGWVSTLLLTSAGAVGGKEVGQTIGSLVEQNLGDILRLKDGRILNSWCN